MRSRSPGWTLRPTARPFALVAPGFRARAFQAAVAVIFAAAWLAAAAAQESQEAQPASAGSLRLSAKLDKVSIVPYEPLWLTVTVENVSRGPVLLQPTPGVPLCRLEAPEGQPLEWGRPQQVPLVASRIVLASREARSAKVELNHLFDLGRSLGRHKVIVAYPMLQVAQKGRHGRLKELEATGSFRVAAPKGQADSEALADFRRAIEQHMAWRGRVIEAVRAGYRQVLERHANSRYAEYADYWLARSWQDSLNYAKAREAYQAFVDGHPKSGYAQAARRGLEQLGALALPEEAVP